MSSLLGRLKPKERRGSKPRCHLLTHGSPDVVASRLTTLVQPFASVTLADYWMPGGFESLEEAELHKVTGLLPPGLSKTLGEWWLPADAQERRAPNFDIASTCTVGGSPGLLLVEAKAHERELANEAVGRRLRADASPARKASHETIGWAIDSARTGLNSATKLSWQISRDSHYQMSNRFAWAWKLTELGVPVVLVYLGFLKADDMSKPGEVPFSGFGAWENAIRVHSAPLFPWEVWGRQCSVNGVPLIPLIRSLELPLNSEATQ
jgi:hypothetical protein